MLEDFKKALARVQSDYGFYVDCQENPAAALAGYDLTVDERSALSDPEKLAEAFKPGVGVLNLRPSITVKISGKHDWVNIAIPEEAAVRHADRDAKVGLEVEAIGRASTPAERTDAVVRLIALIG